MLGCGEALLTRIVLLGKANVLPMTWQNNTAAIETHNARPDFGLGGGEELGTSARYGTTKYVIGKHSRNKRRQRTVPSRADRVGYTKSCRVMPMTPRIDIASPTRAGGRPMPPVNTKGRWRAGVFGRFGSYTGVERKTNHSELKVPM